MLLCCVFAPVRAVFSAGRLFSALPFSSRVSLSAFQQIHHPHSVIPPSCRCQYLFFRKKYNLQYSVVRLLLILSRDFRALPASTFCPLPLRFRNRSLTVIVMHPILRSPLYQPSSDSFHCFSSLPFPSLFLFLPTRAVFPLDLSAILAGDTPPLLKFL